MRVLALADRPPLTSLREIVAKEKIELIITLGDFDHGDLVELEQITNIPKIGIYGNHCSGTYMPSLGIMNMHHATWEYKGLTFGGFEGCVRYKESDHAPMYTQEECTELMKGFPPVDVFLSHAPPAGINDEPGDVSHAGFTALRNYMDTIKPMVWLHGHTYPSKEDLVTQAGDTRIEYVFRYKVLDLPNIEK